MVCDLERGVLKLYVLFCRQLCRKEGLQYEGAVGLIAAHEAEVLVALRVRICIDMAVIVRTWINMPVCLLHNVFVTPMLTRPRLDLDLDVAVPRNTRRQSPILLSCLAQLVQVSNKYLQPMPSPSSSDIVLPSRPISQ